MVKKSDDEEDRVCHLFIRENIRRVSSEGNGKWTFLLISEVQLLLLDSGDRHCKGQILEFGKMLSASGKHDKWELWHTTYLIAFTMSSNRCWEKMGSIVLCPKGRSAHTRCTSFLPPFYIIKNVLWIDLNLTWVSPEKYVCDSISALLTI